MVEAKHVAEKNICWSNFIDKSKERKIFDFLHCPFEPPAKQHRPVCQLGWILWCMLARPSKGQCRNSKIFPPLLLAVKADQNIFFPETCFASAFQSLNSQCAVSTFILSLLDFKLFSNLNFPWFLAKFFLDSLLTTRSTFMFLGLQDHFFHISKWQKFCHFVFHMICIMLAFTFIYKICMKVSFEYVIFHAKI